MTIIGTRLLHRRAFFDHYSRTVTSRILKMIPEMVRDEPDVSHEEIATRSWNKAELHPLDIGAVKAIRIELAERRFYNSYGCKMSGYLAEAEVRYYGSAALWAAQPTPDFTFPFFGKAGTTHMRVRTFLDAKEFGLFEEDVLKHVGQAREAVRDFDASIVFFNQVAETRIREQLAARADWIETLREQTKRPRR